MWQPLNSRGHQYGLVPWCLVFWSDSVWTNGPESSSKVSSETGIGPWMALPSSVPNYQGVRRSVRVSPQNSRPHAPECPRSRGQKLNANIFFSNFLGASGISRQNPGISRQKSLIPWVSRDIPNFLAPTLSRGRPPPHQKISGLKSSGLGSFFVPEEVSREYPEQDCRVGIPGSELVVI